eukprot:582717-Pelagomonas_calceolata.AAC.1
MEPPGKRHCRVKKRTTGPLAENKKAYFSQRKQTLGYVHLKNSNAVHPAHHLGHHKGHRRERNVSILSWESTPVTQGLG